MRAGSLLLLALVASLRAETETVGLLPSSPHYFSAPDGSPLLLVGDYTWGTFSDREPEYDYATMFDTLKSHGLNFARVWLWWGCEFFPQEIGRRNFIPCPRPGPGAARDGLPKWDLSRFDDGFFTRLTEVCTAARERGIVLQLTLFDAWNIKHTELWEVHPFHRDNNINGVDGDPGDTATGTDGRQGFCSLGNPAAMDAQRRFVDRVVRAVNDFDNILLEIANENYYSAEWELELCRYIHQLEADLPRQHLVMPLDLPNHDYGGIKTWDIDKLHLGLMKARELGQPLLLDTDGIGTPERDRGRRAFWTAFVGGGHVSYLDESLQPGVEFGGDPRGSKWEPQRTELGILARFSRLVRFWEMAPDDALVRAGRAFAMGSDREFVAYLPDGGEATLDLSRLPAQVRGTWVDPRTGEMAAAQVGAGAECVVKAPGGGDWVLWVRAQ